LLLCILKIVYLHYPMSPVPSSTSIRCLHLLLLSSMSSLEARKCSPSNPSSHACTLLPSATSCCQVYAFDLCFPFLLLRRHLACNLHLLQHHHLVLDACWGTIGSYTCQNLCHVAGHPFAHFIADGLGVLLRLQVPLSKRLQVL